MFMPRERHRNTNTYWGTGLYALIHTVAKMNIDIYSIYQYIISYM